MFRLVGGLSLTLDSTVKLSDRMKAVKRVSDFLRREKGLAYVSLGNFSSAVLGALFWIILAWVLNIDEYGETNYYIASASIPAAISLLGLDTTVIAYLAKGEEPLLHEADSVVLISTLLLGTLLSLFHWGSSLVMMAMVFYTMSLAEVLGRRLYKEYGVICVASRLIQILLSLSLYFLIGLRDILAGYFLGLLILSYRYLNGLRRFNLKLENLRRNLHFTLHSYGLNLTRNLSSYLDKIVIGSFLGFDILGLYQLGYQFLMFLSVIPSSLYTYMLPEESSGKSNRLVELVGIGFSVAMAAVMFLLVPWLITAFLPRFLDAIPLVRVMCLGVIPATVRSTCNAKLLGKGRSKPVLIGGLIYLTCLMTGFIALGYTFKELGLAFSMVVAQTTSAVFLWKNLKPHPSLKKFRRPSHYSS